MDIKPRKKPNPTSKIKPSDNGQNVSLKINQLKTKKPAFRKILRRRKRKATQAKQQVDKTFEKHLIRRFSHLARVQRFLLGWFMIVAALVLAVWWQLPQLDEFYLTSAPASGGIYREGLIGSFTNSNPLYATGNVDLSVSRLIYSGLFTVNGQGAIEPLLADSYKLDNSGKQYTVKLRQNVFWHDGQPFNADDVLFTYQTIQDPDSKSPLLNSWKSVKVQKIDDYTVLFKLPNVYSAFPYSLVNGIVPEHILATKPVENLRSNLFNTINAVGTGPFKLQDLVVSDPSDAQKRSEKVVLTKNEGYFLQKPLISGVIIRTYRDQAIMEKAFDQNIIQVMVNPSQKLSIKDDQDVRQYSRPLMSAVMIFMNNSHSILKDSKVRQALGLATDTNGVREGLDFEAIPVDSPFLSSQYSYSSKLVQPKYDLQKANKLLDQAGWKVGPSGIRQKAGQDLRLRVFSQNSNEYSSVLSKVQEDWRQAGVEVEAFLQDEEDIQLGAIARHDYDVLIYGISIGFDPDIYPYWHSSQIQTSSGLGLNLSEYKNQKADDSLEAGRTRSDPKLRKIKYQPFLKSWAKDLPAIGLYQPRFLLVVRGTFEGFDNHPMRSSSDRFNSITNWRIRNDKVFKTKI